MMIDSRNRCNRCVQAESGISIIELLIALLILSSIMIGILPLFQRSVLSNLSSSGTTELVNFGQSAVEDIIRLAFNSELLDMTGTAGLERVVNEYYDEATHAWVDGAPPAGVAAMTRTLRIRQFGIGAIEDGIVDDADSLNGGADPRSVHLKQVVVELTGKKSHLRLPHQTLNLTLFKSN